MPAADGTRTEDLGTDSSWPRGAVARGAVLTGLTLAGLLLGLLTGGAVRWGFFALSLLAGGIPAAREAVRALVAERKLDVDLLMVVAALGAASVGQAADGAILLFLFSLSNTLQDWALGRTKGAIEALMALNPEGARRVSSDGSEEWVALEDLRAGDEVRVRPGERIPADARLLEGHTSVDESALTGESVPIDKEPGSALLSGTLNGTGVVRARVERAASESTLAKLVRLVEQAQAAKGPTERFAERFEGPYTILVLLSVPVVFAGFHLLGDLGTAQAWYRAMTFLVVASPCAVVISTPAAVLSAMAAGARSGALFKSGAALEALAAAEIVAFDKTGTLTEGKMWLERVIPLDGDEAGLRALAAGLERHSEHPIARAIVRAWRGPVPELTGVRAVPGQGVVGVSNGEEVWAGTRRLAESRGVTIDAKLERRLTALEEEGFTTVLLGRGGRPVAILTAADRVREEARETVAALRATGHRVVMLTGDREVVARRIAREVGIDEIRAELLPEDKLTAVSELERAAPTVMVGDGINDAPALAAAHLGVAMGAGSDVSIESADVVLLDGDLLRLRNAVELARRAARTIRFNLTFALSIIGGVGTLALFGQIPLPLGVIAHEGGTLFVVAVGLRLLAHRDRRHTTAGAAAAGARQTAPPLRSGAKHPAPALGE